MSVTMSYEQVLNKELKLPRIKKGPVVLDLFAGCGGMALGFEAAGWTWGGRFDAPDYQHFSLSGG